ncbi:TPA: GIY-YIG nuclease family protein [Escherichia coli]|nr:GIY-YIG nuclease family protein [Escherichia coli]
MRIHSYLTRDGGEKVNMQIYKALEAVSEALSIPLSVTTPVEERGEVLERMVNGAATRDIIIITEEQPLYDMTKQRAELIRSIIEEKELYLLRPFSDGYEPEYTQDLSDVANLDESGRRGALIMLTSINLYGMWTYVKHEKMVVTPDQKTPLPPPTPTLAYVIRAGKNLCKIGYSHNPKGRVNSIARSMTEAGAIGKKTLTLEGAFTFEKISAHSAEIMAHLFFARKNAGMKGFDGATEFFNVDAKKACAFFEEAGGIRQQQ